MVQSVQGVVALLGRILLSTIFFMSAVGKKIPDFNGTAGYMESAGVPAARFMLVGAIAFLIVGSLSVIVGYKARIGATLLLIFLILATYYFHNFWTIADEKLKGEQMIQFMKNLSMAGAMLFLIGNGSGPMSLDNRAKSL